jgi:hypothetical protein
MNAYVSCQTSGRDWPGPNHAGTLLAELGQESQANVPARPRRNQEDIILQDFERQMAEFAVERGALIAELKKFFVLSGEASVKSFLFERRSLPQLLLEAVSELKTYFGRETVFRLTAPTDGFGSQTLYAVAVWPGAAADVRHALKKFDECWWLSRSHQAAGYLTFTYELV